MQEAAAGSTEEMHQNPVPSDSLRKLERAGRAIALTNPPNPEIQTELVAIEEEIGTVHDRVEDVRTSLANECETVKVRNAILEHKELLQKMNNIVKRIEKHKDIQYEMGEAAEAVRDAQKALATDFAEFITFSCL